MKRFQNALIGTIFIIITFTCCIPNPPGGGTVTPIPVYTEFKNTLYGADSKQKMDIYLPAGRSATNTKTIMLIHGGGWQVGDKDEQRFVNIINRIKVKMPNVAIANINYRLVNGGGNPTLPDLISDIGNAISFLKTNGNNYQISSNFALWGLSAGGHLATLYAYHYDTNNDVKVVSDWFGPTDFVNTLQVDAALIILGKNIYSTQKELLGGIDRDQNFSLWQNASPLTWVSSTSKPTIIIHDQTDLNVPINNSILLKDKLTQFGVVNSFIDAKGIVDQTMLNQFGFVLPYTAHDFSDPGDYFPTPDNGIVTNVRNYTVDTTLGFIKRFL